MTKDDITRMAREAGATPYTNRHYPERPTHTFTVEQLERFVELATAAKEAEHKEAMRWDIHSCGPMCKRYACVATREAVAAEREACASICESEWSTTQEHVHGLALADIMRARGQA